MLRLPASNPASLWQLGATHAGPRADATLGVKELAVLRAEVERVAPPEAVEPAGPLVELFRGAVRSGDHLRLPQETALSGPAMQAAIGRILRADTSAPGAAPSEVVKEQRMLAVLRGLVTTTAEIQGRASRLTRPATSR